MLTGRHKKDGRFYKKDVAHRKGHDEWIEVARRRNAPKMLQIQRGTHVYFSNKVHGDNDMGRSSVFYMKSMQESTYWLTKLRAENRPYETAQETILHMQQELATAGPKQAGVFTYRGHRDAWQRYL